MRSLAILFLRAALLCAGLADNAGGQSGVSRTALDSIVLERTPCYGTCPAYRLSIDRRGIVRFTSHNRGDSAGVVRDSISADALQILLRQGTRLGVLQLPPVIADDHELCPDHATDHPTATIGLFWPTSARKIVDYHGCFLRADHSTASAVDSLRVFEDMIDSVAAAERWIRPNRGHY